MKEYRNIQEIDEIIYEKNDLGCVYSKSFSIFTLWAPLASKVFLKIENENGAFDSKEMSREEKGIFRIKVKGNLINKKYHYVVFDNGEIKETNDPYGIGVSTNSEYSVVIDLSQLDKIKKVKPTNDFSNYCEAIIYELNVRDFTEDNFTDIEQKGKFLGLVEENRKTKKGNPAGLDYLKYLGITHVQLQPITDFNGVDDLNTSRSYNWGYDPLSYFAIEGSYSSFPVDPISRLKELKTMVSKLHENNIRVNVDVVFNHIYKYEESYLEKCVPGYYFRKTASGEIANASGCGNDIRTEAKMMRKMIIDSLIYLIKTFDVDGFRFDLMGLIDKDTLNLAYKICTEIKPEIMFYGEGWDMGIELSTENKGCLSNYKNLPGIAFFNDKFRNLIAGPVFKDRIWEKGFISGRNDCLDQIEEVYFGSSINKQREAMFDFPTRSINYVECHDNCALFDKLSLIHQNESEELILKRIKFANKMIALSFGIPFYHMGQEIGLSKSEQGNTYNLTKINNFKYRLLDERFEMASYLKILLDLRKKLNRISISSKDEIVKNFESYIKDNCIYIKCLNNEMCKPYNNLMFIINNNDYNQPFELDDYYTLFTGGVENKELIATVKNNFVPRNSICVLYKRGK